MPVAADSMLVLDSSIFGITHPIAFSTATSVELSTSILSSSGIAELLLNKLDDASYNENEKWLRKILPFKFSISLSLLLCTLVGKIKGMSRIL